MDLFDCIRCRCYPCGCGWDYRLRSVESVQERIDLLQKVLRFRADHPNAKFSENYPEVETEDDREFMRYMEEDR